MLNEVILEKYRESRFEKYSECKLQKHKFYKDCVKCKYFVLSAICAIQHLHFISDLAQLCLKFISKNALSHFLNTLSTILFQIIFKTE